MVAYPTASVRIHLSTHFDPNESNWLYSTLNAATAIPPTILLAMCVLKKSLHTKVLLNQFQEIPLQIQPSQQRSLKHILSIFITNLKPPIHNKLYILSPSSVLPFSPLTTPHGPAKYQETMLFKSTIPSDKQMQYPRKCT